METNNEHDQTGDSHVPLQQTGSEMNATAELELGSEAEAVYFFQTVKARLLDVNRWKEIAGAATADFMLTDAGGKPVSRMATGGDHIKIDIPGPGPRAGGGFDWVTIEEIRLQELDDVEILSMTARPSANPLSDQDETAHFLKDTATSTFQVKRIGTRIYAEEHGRNEVPNTETDHQIDNLRNTFVGWAAKIGFSYPQWKALVDGLLKQ
ncbi:hypothetical protein PBAL39_00440 [Pedobacter sp. BAL39]|uniref:hypothetical protein n=1 Tax=Pedobacter sp. BAL39 TaxID=391596 RepID=UPI0001559257|nr:hypothetical protein [Pedobacter sp. BAL39]EDM34954.1 hypothetical protein PBAL39_00440 [Pedobacter sp. BAL39]